MKAVSFFSESLAGLLLGILQDSLCGDFMLHRCLDLILTEKS